MRRFTQKHSHQSTLSELNVTPLLDLAFVLLIIFMITTPIMDKTVDLVIPSSVQAKNAVDPAAVQTIAITRDEVIKLNGEPVALDQLTPQLTALRAVRPDLAVVIRAHKELPVQQLVDVMDAVKAAGVAKLGVVTNPESE